MNDRLPPDVSPIVNESGIPIQPLYTEDDLRVLDSIKRHLSEGRSIGEVEALGRAALLAAGRG